MGGVERLLLNFGKVDFHHFFHENSFSVLGQINDFDDFSGILDSIVEKQIFGGFVGKNEFDPDELDERDGETGSKGQHVIVVGIG